MGALGLGGKGALGYMCVDNDPSSRQGLLIQSPSCRFALSTTWLQSHQVTQWTNWLTVNKVKFGLLMLPNIAHYVEKVKLNP